LVNLPIGIVAALMLIRYLPASPKQARRFDLFGFALLALALGGLQMMLDRGEQVDWFESWEVWIEAGIAIAAGWMFVVHMVTARRPLFDPRMFADRNFVVGLLFMLVLGIMLLAGLALLPPLLQGLYGYSVLQAGILTMPRGVGTLVSMIIASRLVGRVDARLLVLAGMLLMALSLHQMSGFALEMDSRPIIVSGLVQGLALGLLFVPLNTLAFATMEARFRTTGAALFNLSRNIGGSVGISIVTAFLGRNLQVSHADIAANLTPGVLPPVDPALTQGAQPLTQAALAMLDAEVNRQALMIAYIDDFHLMMIVSLAAVPLLVLLRGHRRPA
jgi:DHA2 family multidrug resistance protein